jgi:hypothetical protein
MDNYWLLYRHKDADIFIVGEPVMPYGFHIGPDYRDIQAKLAERLNESDAFDKPIIFSDNDRLEIIFNNLQMDDRKRMKFCFEYSHGEWVAAYIEAIAKDELFEAPLIGEIMENEN